MKSLKRSVPFLIGLSLCLLVFFLVKTSSPRSAPVESQTAGTSEKKLSTVLDPVAASRVAGPSAQKPQPVAIAKFAPERLSASGQAMFEGLKSLAKGSKITLPVTKGVSLAGNVVFAKEYENGAIVVNGQLADGSGRFQIAREPWGFRGYILQQDAKTAYKYSSDTAGNPQVIQAPFNSVVGVAMPIPPSAAAAAKAGGKSNAVIAAGSVSNGGETVGSLGDPVPSLQSKPFAKAVIYMDLDGQVVGVESGWGSEPIVSSAYQLSTSEMTDMWRIVAEDYAPFDVNVTTDLQVYLSAPQGNRIRCVISPEAFGDAGVAIVGSFKYSGENVCWDSYRGKDGAEVVSHEVGHTLGLDHHGDSTGEYFLGFGGNPQGWAPIMGGGYYHDLVQFSKGDYPGADYGRDQDDLAVLADYVATSQDDHADSGATATLLVISGPGDVSGNGIIETRDDVDAFRFTTGGGPVTLNFNGQGTFSNLDILAKLYDAGGTLIASDNPVDGLNAVITADLPAGTYTVTVDGTGTGDWSNDTYDDYGSLGQYTISGNISAPSWEFQILSSTQTGGKVGTVASDSGSSYSITGGNSGNAFAIDGTTGLITVQTPASLSLQNLFTLDIALVINGTPLNVSVPITILPDSVPGNHAPSIANRTFIVNELLSIGTSVGTPIATDPQGSGELSFSIIGGNDGSAFLIDPSTGGITTAAALDFIVHSKYTLIVQVTDPGGLSATAKIRIEVLPSPVKREVYYGIPGVNVADLTSSASYPDSPSTEEYVTSLEAPTYTEVDFGQRLSGYLRVPQTGEYTFWIAAHDSAELWLSTDSDPANKVRICDLASSSNWHEWEKYPSQTVTLTLEAGKFYYIEALMKQGNDGFYDDHLGVLWAGPGIDPTILSAPYIVRRPANFGAPVLAANSAVIADLSTQSVTFVTRMFASDPDDMGSSVTFSITGGNGPGYFTIDPITGQVATTGLPAPVGSYPLTVTATDNSELPLSTDAILTVDVRRAALKREVWENIDGTEVADLTGSPAYPGSPDYVDYLVTAEYTNYKGNYDSSPYGARSSGWLTAPATGTYYFYIASDDSSELWLSPDGDAANKVKIANVVEWSGEKSWEEMPSQKSVAISLVAGTQYYIEVLHKDGSPANFMAIGWQSTSGGPITDLPADSLSPFYTSTGLADWQANSPGAGTLPDSNNDGDRYNDLLEYALGSDPATGRPVVHGLTAEQNDLSLGLSLENPNGSNVDLTFVRPTADRVPDLTYEIEQSSDLVQWTAVSTGSTDTSLGDGLESVRYAAMNSSALRGFVRLKITHDSGAVAYTAVSGWSLVPLQGTSQSLGFNFVKPPVFTGIIASASGDSLVIAGSDSKGIASAFEFGKTCYLEITGGPAAGHRFDIGTVTANAGTTGTVAVNFLSANTTAAVLPAGLAGAPFILRQHLTLGEFLPKEHFVGSANYKTAAQVQFMSAGAFVSYYLLDGAPSAPAYYFWAKVGSVASSEGLIVPAGAGGFITRLSGVADQLIFQTGEVRANAFREKMTRPGKYLIASGYPLDDSTSGRQMDIAHGFVGSANFTNADKLYLLAGDTVPNTVGYQTYYLLNGGSPAYQYWTQQGSIANQNAAGLVKTSRAQLLELKAPAAVLQTTIQAPWTP